VKMRLNLNFLVLLVCAFMSHAQDLGGSLIGVVEDSRGFRLTSARVRVRSEAPFAERTIESDNRGEFRIDDLRPGEYQIAVQSEGFTDASAKVFVAVSTVRGITVTMQPSIVRESIDVDAFASSIATQPIDSTSQVHQATVTRQDLTSLPMAQRSFANIAYLAPGTEPVEPSDPTKARITAVSTGGSSGLNNELSIDGMDDSDDYIGGFLQNFSIGSIQEFSVRTAQEDADTGGTTAGSVVIVTRRGNNEWHGSAALLERASALNARYPIENPPPEPKQRYSRQDYEGTVGGPLLPRKMWFFFSLEGTREDSEVAYSSASMEQFNALATLASKGLTPKVSSISTPSTVPVPFRDFSDSLRLDWAQSAKSSWFLRASTDSYSTQNNLVQQATLPSTGLSTRDRYWNMVLENQFLFSPEWIGSLVFGASDLHLAQKRNSDLGFALAFPFSSTALTISGFETFGDNQFATPITFFPSLRNQEKYQARYDLTNELRHHSVRSGVNFIHEPVLSGAFPRNTETLYQLPQNPTYYLANPSQLALDMAAGESTSQLGGGFAQNVQRLALYAQDSWRATKNFALNYGLRYSTTVGLFNASGRTQVSNPAYITLHALGIPLANGAPVDGRKQIAPRIGFVYSVGHVEANLIRAGLGMYFNDLAQNGWATAFQAVNSPPGPCVTPVEDPNGPENAGCVPGHDFGGSGNLIAPEYRTPYAIHVSVGFQHEFNSNSALGIDYTHEQGSHGYRAYRYQGGKNLFTPRLSILNVNQASVVPDINDFHSDNRSGYDALMMHLQENVGHHLNLVANYTLSNAGTWGCVLGELFDYVNGVCDPLHPFGTGDYGPSGEDVRHRFVFAGTWHAPGSIEISALTQMETARPFTITTVDGKQRISINRKPTALDQFRGTPYIQSDLRAARPVRVGDRWLVVPFVECFNLFNRVNPGANYVTNVASLPVPSAEAKSGNVSDICINTDCTATKPLGSPNQLRGRAGSLGDFFGPGTTVGTAFAAQLGLHIEF